MGCQGRQHWPQLSVNLNCRGIDCRSGGRSCLLGIQDRRKSSMSNSSRINSADLERAGELLGRPAVDTFSYLGVMAERVSIGEQRLAAGRAVPAWSSDDDFRKVA